MTKDLVHEIKEIADNLRKNGSTFTRADLAYELKIKDSVEVERLVYEAYTRNNKSKTIYDAFISNDGSISLVKAYIVTASLSEERQDDAISIIMGDLQMTDSQINTLNKLLDYALSNEANKRVAGILDYATGSAGVKNIQNEASHLFEKYSQLVDSYIESKACVSNDISDFIELRTNIMMIFQKYSMALVDIFGESIKIIEPKLFDFNQIQYLDVSQMLKTFELEYNQIADKCPILLNEIYDSFKDNFSRTINTFSTTNTQDNKIALISAGLSFLNHYFDASQKTNQLRQELSNFKISVKKDVATINGDKSRLLVIHKTLNDLYIPKASIFYRHCINIFNEELQNIIDSIYTTPKAKELKQKRDEIIIENERLIREINDHKENIAFYEASIKDIKAHLQGQKGNYDRAISEKPRKPLLCFGPMKDKYYRELSDWDRYFAPLIDNYNNMTVELTLSQKELQSHISCCDSDIKKQKKCSESLNDISKEMMRHLSTDDSTKAKVLKHLKQIIGLLNLAKEIVQSKIDDKLLSTINIKHIDTLALTPDIENRINSFTNELSKTLKMDLEIDEALSEEEKEKYTEDVNESIERGVSALNTFLFLQQQMEHERISMEEYDRQLHDIQESFMNDINEIDEKGEYLREVFRQINTSDNNDDLREALSKLTDNNINISDKNFNLFLAGKKKIEL